ncbi:unnamed protein product [Rotaria socialis]
MMCCEKCKQLLAYTPRDGTASLAKHKRSCQTTDHTSVKDSVKQTQVTEYYSSKKSQYSRAFEMVSGDGFLKVVQSVFDAGRHFSPTQGSTKSDKILLDVSRIGWVPIVAYSWTGRPGYVKHLCKRNHSIAYHD